MTMLLIKIALYIAVWIFMGWLISLYFKFEMCDAWKSCSKCKHIERRWNKFAWSFDAVIAVIGLILLLK